MSTDNPLSLVNYIKTQLCLLYTWLIWQNEIHFKIGKGRLKLSLLRLYVGTFPLPTLPNASKVQRLKLLEWIVLNWTYCFHLCRVKSWPGSTEEVGSKYTVLWTKCFCCQPSPLMVSVLKVLETEKLKQLKLPRMLCLHSNFVHYMTSLGKSHLLGVLIFEHFSRALKLICLFYSRLFWMSHINYICVHRKLNPAKPLLFTALNSSALNYWLLAIKISVTQR